MIDWQIIIYQAIPYLLIGIPILVLINWFLKQNIKTKQIELSMAMQKEMLPLRIQAYERLTILLERINPDAMILREQKPGLTNLQLHTSLLKNIRSEFEHNLAMQIYLPVKTWDLILKSRDEVIKLINTSAGEVKTDAPSMELSQKILERYSKESDYYLKQAKEALKKDIQQYYFS
nr:hypothetical protein [uncultured Carboxylicivirga sp.]